MVEYKMKKTHHQITCQVGESNLSKVKLVSFDLDDTLIRGVHSVMLPCILNGKGEECLVIDRKEEAGELDYISADYCKAELLDGLAEHKIAESLLDIINPINDIAFVVDTLHKNSILCIVITVGPRQVAKAICDIYGFDGYYGSDYEVENGVFTGRIRKYLSAESKAACLSDFCRRKNINPDECVAVGDGSTDIPVFEYCGKSIALNASPDVKRKASFAIDTQSLIDILCYII
jgi:phosphoserine phosphatase